MGLGSSIVREVGAVFFLALELEVGRSAMMGIFTYWLAWTGGLRDAKMIDSLLLLVHSSYPHSHFIWDWDWTFPRFVARTFINYDREN